MKRKSKRSSRALPTSEAQIQAVIEAAQTLITKAQAALESGRAVDTAQANLVAAQDAAGVASETHNGNLAEVETAREALNAHFA